MRAGTRGRRGGTRSALLLSTLIVTVLVGLVVGISERSARAERPADELIPKRTAVLRLSAGAGDEIAAHRDAAQRILLHRLSLKNAGRPTFTPRGADRLVVTYKDGPSSHQLSALLGQRGRLRVCPAADGETSVLGALDGELPAGVRLRAVPRGAEERSYELEAGARVEVERAIAVIGARLPRGVELFPQHAPSRGGEPLWRTIAIRPARCRSLGKVSRAFIRFQASPAGGSPEAPAPQLQIELDASATERFAEMTRGSVGRRIVVLLDDDVLQAPLVRDPITTGRLSYPAPSYLPPEEALGELSRLSAVLQSGPLPLSVEVVDFNEELLQNPDMH